jgi:hypothetical protein
VRTSLDLRRNPIDHWVLAYCRGDTAVLSAKNVHLDAHTGVPFVWSLLQPSDGRRTAAVRLQLYLPRDSFSDLAPLQDGAAGSMLNTPLGHLLGDCMFALKQSLPALASADISALTKQCGS